MPIRPPASVSAELFAEVELAGGSLVIAEDDKTNYRALIANSIGSPSRPYGTKLEATFEGPYYRLRVVEIHFTEHV